MRDGRGVRGKRTCTRSLLPEVTEVKLKQVASAVGV